MDLDLCCPVRKASSRNLPSGFLVVLQLPVSRGHPTRGALDSRADSRSTLLFLPWLKDSPDGIGPAVLIRNYGPLRRVSITSATRRDIPFNQRSYHFCFRSIKEKH